MNIKLVTMLLAITVILSAASIIEANELVMGGIGPMTDVSISGPPLPPVNFPPMPPVNIPPMPPFDMANDRPSDEEVYFSQRTGDHLLNMLLTALVKEIGDTTLENVDEGNLAIGLMFNDLQTNFRLVGTFEPLSDNDYPQDDFEETALAQALQGQPYTEVQRVRGKWYYRSSIPLSNFVPQCAMCHPNFESFDSTDNVGALMLKVPIKRS